jgi:hypothetical protein
MMCESCWIERGSPNVQNERVYAAVDAIERVYDSHPTGGKLHVVLDDDNIEDHHITWCALGVLGFDECEMDCLMALYPLSIDERATALGIFNGYILREGQ